MWVPALLAVLVALVALPAVHRVAPTDGWLDRAAARSLDRLEGAAEAVGLAQDGPLAARLSGALQGSGATLFNPVSRA